MLLKPIITIRNQVQIQIYYTTVTSSYFGSHQYFTLLASQNSEGAPDAQQLQVFVSKSNDNSGLKNEFYIFD